MTHSRKARGQPFRLTVLLVALFPVFAGLYVLLADASPTRLLNSDLVQPFLVARDVLADPASILDWHLSPAIYIFPDTVLALVISLFHLGPVTSFLAYGGVFGVLLSLAGGTALHFAGSVDLFRASLAMAAGMIVLSLTGLALPGALDTQLHAWMLSPFIHSGALLCGLALIGLWAGAEIVTQRRKGFFAASLFIGVLGAHSDLIFFVYFVVPVAITTGIAFLVSPDRGRFVRTLLLVLVSLAGYLSDRLTRGNSGPGGKFDIVPNVIEWWGYLAPHLPGTPLLVVSFLATPVMLIRAAYLAVRALRERVSSTADYIEITLAGAMAAAVLVPALFGVSMDIWGLRYSLPIGLLPLVWVLVLMRSWIARPWPFRSPTIWGAGAWAATIALIFVAGLPAYSRFTAPPPVVACLDAFGRDAAYADFWNANGPVFLSDYSVHVLHMETDGTRSRLNVNDRWLTRSMVDGGPVLVDAIIIDRLEPDKVETVFGPPATIAACSERTFWLYDAPLRVPPP